MVVTAPMPSMPVSFWNDPDGTRYRDAYFTAYPGVWRHGDWVELTDRGSITIHGRSDATLNRNGIRMGSADIYEVVEAVAEGLDNAGVARRLFMSEGTVRNHISSILAKLGLRNRTQVAVLYYRSAQSG